MNDTPRCCPGVQTEKQLAGFSASVHPIKQLNSTQVVHGDNMAVLRRLISDGVQVDSVVTDPPYGLSFMGKKWDYDVPSVELWQLVHQVLKPGGHVLSFGGTRTYHRMVVNLEDAGFEPRDAICWVYGSGFPKSLDVAKAIDKAAGAKRKVISERLQKVGFDTKAQGGGGWASGKIGITAPATESAKQWEGWGTGLKPSVELVSLSRKPLSEKTIAANVLRWGTGSLNIDGCRVSGNANWHRSISKNASWKFAATYAQDRWTREEMARGANEEGSSKGRWPANLITDGSDEVLAGFPETKRNTTSTRGRGGNKYAAGKGFANTLTETGQPIGFGDSGSAGRFFYCAKASRVERCDSKHPTVKPLALMRYLCRLITPPGGTILDPFAGSGSTGEAAILEGFTPILIELEREYVAEIHKRMKRSAQGLLKAVA